MFAIRTIIYVTMVSSSPAFPCTFNYWNSTEFNNFKAWDQNLNYGSTFNNPQKKSIKLCEGSECVLI